jgi:hypothetical protein
VFPPPRLLIAKNPPDPNGHKNRHQDSRVPAGIISAHGKLLLVHEREVDAESGDDEKSDDGWNSKDN